MSKNIVAIGNRSKKSCATIRSTFLRLLVRFYGILSIQLTPLRWNPRSVITFVWNLSITALYIHLYIAAIKYHSNRPRNDIAGAKIAQKPLFGMLIKLYLNSIYLIAYIIVTIYFIVISNIFRNGQHNNNGEPHCELVTLLDSIRASCFDSFRSGRRLFFAMLAGHQVLYAITVASLIIKSLTGQTPINKMEHLPASTATAVTYVLFFTLSVHISTPFILSHYYKYATLCALRAQHNKLRIAQTKRFRKPFPDRFANDAVDEDNVLREFENEIHRLAILNRRLDAILSIPLLITIVAFIIDITIHLVGFWIDDGHIPDNAYLLQFLLHMMIIASLEKRIQRHLCSIRQLLKDYRNPRWSETNESINLFTKNVSFQPKLYATNSNNWARRSRFNMIDGSRDDAARSNQVQSMESVAIRRREVMNVFEKYFRLRLLNLVYLDWPFLFEMTIFITNYVVLVAQTSN